MGAGYSVSISTVLALCCSPRPTTTARLWSVPTLRSLGVLRPSLREGYDGQLYAAALSKDGSMGAVSGFSKGPLTVHVFDVARCEIVRQVTVNEVVEESVMALRFSRSAIYW